MGVYSPERFYYKNWAVCACKTLIMQATHFIEVWKDPSIKDTHTLTTKCHPIQYLQKLLFATKASRLKTIAIFKIKAK